MKLREFRSGEFNCFTSLAVGCLLLNHDTYLIVNIVEIKQNKMDIFSILMDYVFIKAGLMLNIKIERGRNVFS